MRSPGRCLLAGFVCAAGGLRAASFDDRVEALFRPPLGEMMALSPNGQRVAYTAQAGRELSVVLLNLDNPKTRRTVNVNPDGDAISGEMQRPAPLRFLRWATDDRLIFAPAERIAPLPAVNDGAGRLVPNPDGPAIVSPIVAVDGDGRERATVIDAAHFQETPAEARRSLADLLRTPQELAAVRKGPVHWRMPHLDIVGFHPRDREQLIIQTHGGYSLPTQHLVDIRTGNVREFGNDLSAPPGGALVFDWFWMKVVGERQVAAPRPTTVWRDEELARVQRELEAKFPRRVVELADWNDLRTRVLFRVTGDADPGRVFIYQRREDLVMEIFCRAPWLAGARLNDTRFFELDAADGARLSGYLTWPDKPRLDPPPLLVVFPSEFPGAAQPAFDPEAQVFADLGFIVVRFNHRSGAGKSADSDRRSADVDRKAVGDARAAIEWLAAQKRPFDRKRVATLGHGFGGYLAVRALQLEPAVFHCGVAIDAPLEQVDALKNPLLLLVEPKRSATIDATNAELRGRMQRAGRAVDSAELTPGFAAAVPASRTAAYRKIAEFFNQRLHDYSVQIGPVKEVK